MAKAISAVDVLADKLIVDAAKSLVLAYQQTKLSGGITGTQSIDFKAAERILVRRAIAKNRRGNSGFNADISSVGQVP